MCFGSNPKWKDEFVVEHKFDYINLADFDDGRLWTRFTYCFIYALALKDVVSYVTDLLAVILLFRDGKQTNDVFSSIPVDVLKWVYLFCTVASLVLLGVETRKARRVVRSADISFSFTNTLVYRYYSFKDYLYYCFFEQIHDMKSGRDRIALFVFFRLKDWKKLLFAQAPRNAINILILTTIYRQQGLGAVTLSESDFIRSSTIVLLTLTTAIFVLSLVGTIIALFLYVPLICQIRGNLKEYCCHKIDKRITKLIARSAQEIAQLAKLNEKRLMNGAVPALPPKGRDQQSVASPTSASLLSYTRPTLPRIDDNDDNDNHSNLYMMSPFSPPGGGSVIGGRNGSGTPLRSLVEMDDNVSMVSRQESYLSFAGSNMSRAVVDPRSQRGPVQSPPSSSAYYQPSSVASSRANVAHGSGITTAQLQQMYASGRHHVPPPSQTIPASSLGRSGASSVVSKQSAAQRPLPPLPPGYPRNL